MAGLLKRVTKRAEIPSAGRGERQRGAWPII